jgi:hypothetical protein
MRARPLQSRQSLQAPLAIMGGLFSHSLMPLGMLGHQDVLFRALLTGAAAAIVALVVNVVTPSPHSV